MIRPRSEWPTDTEIEIAYALLGKLIARGNDPQLDADGLIRMGGLVTERELTWATANRGAFKAALVGAERYVKGTLDRTYKIESNIARGSGNEPPDESK